MRRLRSKIFLVSAILVVLFGVVCSSNSSHVKSRLLTSSSGEAGTSWQIFDNITPTLSSIEWFEEGTCNATPSRISDGRWYQASCEHFLVRSEYIFASFHDSFNWTAVNAGFVTEGSRTPYSSFDAFLNETTTNPRWWLEYSWHVDIEGLGVPSDQTMVSMELDPKSSQTDVVVSLHIDNVPGYFLAYVQNHQPLLECFDLWDISFGNVEDLRLSENYALGHMYYKFFIKAPASLLVQQGSAYSFSIWIDPHYVGQISNVSQAVKIFMPSETCVQTAAPSNMSTLDEDAVVFQLRPGDKYPESFSVISGPPVKSFTEILLENVGRWATEPEIWVALGTAIAAFYAIFHGKRVWERQKVYYRLYKSMVNLYDHYCSDFKKFNKEIENLSKSVSKHFIEGKINDDQFDKLLTRRDDLIDRAKRQFMKD